jgi:hypothetical protein
MGGNLRFFQLRKLAYAIIHSSTIILPKWWIVLKEKGLPERMMPRDITTRWNSTYNMLEFTVEYRPAINEITGGRGLSLRRYELNEEEWLLAGQLRDVLKARTPKISLKCSCPVAL